MNAFKKKSLYAALAGVSALGAVNVAQAVNVNGDGTGQVLIYPYYTTRADALGNTFQTLLSVVNTTGSVKAVKVRFLEGKNSQEVLDFNLFLSPFDVWTAAVTNTADGSGAQVATADTSCTLPTFGGAAIPFVNYQYAIDGGGTSLDRTKEGYVEIIEMATYTDLSVTGVAATHVKGVPPCGTKLSDITAAAEAKAPSGGLFGGVQLVNVLTGTAMSASATALDNYSIAANYWTSGSIYPNLAQAIPPVSQVQAGNAVYTSTWAPGADPVSAVLMHSAVLNEYVLDAVTASRTDWVLTFPTKAYYVKAGTGAAAGTLFQNNFNTTVGSCDTISLAIFDREEQFPSTPVGFSPPKPGPAAQSLCWEANVLTFQPLGTTYATASPILGSVNFTGVAYTYQNGWLNLGFPAVTGKHYLANAATSITTILGSTTTGNSVVYKGLPVVGFAAVSYTNGAVNVGGKLVQSSYGVDFGHRYTTSITSAQ